MQHEGNVSPVYTAAAVSQLPLRDRVGFGVQARNAVDALARVREAEHAGVRQVWMTSGAAGQADTLTFYAVTAVQTTQIRLGASIVPIYPRHPLVMAQQALAIHDLTPGRLRLGVGPSHRHIIEQMYGLSMKAPLAYLGEYMEVLRSGLWEGKIDHHGTFFNIVFTLPRTAPIPLLVSALGVKAFRLAGEISDGAISWMCPVPYLLNKALPALRAGAEARQRPVPPLVAHVLLAMSTDRAAVRAATRQRALSYTTSPFYAHMFAEAGVPVAADGSGIDALVDALVVAGDEASVQQRMRELLAGGLDELLIVLVPVADEVRERQQLLRLIGSL
ncbi:MAG TPA: LLM class flavin-dependent oxidoreductase [Ktedonobacteraceae bacterium]|nr:LLM class flavin-dependent oxidoreductase [Ktedonobacteraceae bacterium]